MNYANFTIKRNRKPFTHRFFLCSLYSEYLPFYTGLDGALQCWLCWSDVQPWTSSSSLCKVLASFSQAGVTHSAGGCAWLLVATPSVHLSKTHFESICTLQHESLITLTCTVWNKVSCFIWNLLPGSVTDYFFLLFSPPPFARDYSKTFPLYFSWGELICKCLLVLVAFFFWEGDRESLISYCPKLIPCFFVSWFFLQLF